MARARYDLRNDRRARAGALELGGAHARYSRVSTRPLHILLFLLPLIVFYEIGSVMYLSEEVRAERMLGEFFSWFDVGWVHVPAALTVIVLLVWQIISGDRWRVRWHVLGWMWVESILWTAPLLVLGLIVARVLGIESGRGLGDLAAAGALSGAPAASLADLGWQGRATIAIGAGIYEELLFRMVGLALVHFVIVDLLLIKDVPGRVAAVLATSLAFALYHNGVLAGGTVDWALLIYYMIAGAYFGSLYLLRGFGIVVAVHALYDIVVLVRPFG